jgi:hypothetical protein
MIILSPPSFARDRVRRTAGPQPACARASSALADLRSASMGLLLCVFTACSSNPEAKAPSAPAAEATEATEAEAPAASPTEAPVEAAAAPPSSEGPEPDLLAPSEEPAEVANPTPASAAAAQTASPSKTKPKATEAARPHAADTAAYSGPAPCQSKTLTLEPVITACRQGGRNAAKQVMKGAVAKARAAGTTLGCPSCHVDMNRYELKPNALTDLKRWL